MRPDELERRLREPLDALGPAPRAEVAYFSGTEWATRQPLLRIVLVLVCR